MTNKIIRILIIAQLGYLLLGLSACGNSSESKFFKETDVTSKSDSLNAVRFDGETITINAIDEKGDLIGNGQLILHQRNFEIRSAPSEYDGRKPTSGKVTHNKEYEIIAARYFDGDLRILLEGDNGIKGWVSIVFTDEFKEFSTLK